MLLHSECGLLRAYCENRVCIEHVDGMHSMSMMAPYFAIDCIF
ncbi:hypothetical protein BJB45_04590 [Halomonas huangheensis]|uniref:Uncharacterized protein n=1 Tax=Halomonas huangheensis TaxID=1178482 RepID=W1N4G0_9GAMM|nr:hypothetical protein BJB45_04590 [Halomonas huangheensis]